MPLFCPQASMIGTRMGMVWFPVAIGMLVGSPIAGKLIQYQGRNLVWWPLQVFVGLSFVVAVLICLIPLIALHKKAAAAKLAEHNSQSLRQLVSANDSQVTELRSSA